MALQLIQHSDARRFRDAVMGRLIESEAENCAEIGLIQRLADTGHSRISEDELEQPLLLAIQEVHRVESVALQVRKSLMLVSNGSAEAMLCLAGGLASRGWTGKAIVGPSPAVGVLAERFAKLSGRRCRLVVRLHTLQLSEVIWAPSVAGGMRLCTRADRMLLAQWLRAFAAEIGDPIAEDSLLTADRFIDAGRIFFWIDYEPVAMAGWAGRTPNGVRINSVYTPSAFRRRRYASALVANLTQRMLDEGRRFCFLHTDQANPTSNSIYQKIGYRGVSESERWEFGSP